RGEAPEITPEEELRELSREFGKRLEIVEGSLTALWAARAQDRRQHLLEQARLPIRGRPERLQMARRDSELDKARTERRDLDVGLRVAARAVHGARLEQTEGLELAGQLAVDARMGAELVELEVRLLPTQPDRLRLPPSARLGTRRGELLPDDTQRQELVAL